MSVHTAKLMRVVRPSLVVTALVAAVAAFVCFMIGIWTPAWQQMPCTGGYQCWQYAGDDKWFHTAWLLVAAAVASGAGRAAFAASDNKV